MLLEQVFKLIPEVCATVAAMFCVMMASECMPLVSLCRDSIVIWLLGEYVGNLPGATYISSIDQNMSERHLFSFCQQAVQFNKLLIHIFLTIVLNSLLALSNSCCSVFHLPG